MSNNLDFTKSSSYFSGYTRVALAFLIALMLIIFSTDIAFMALLYLKKFYVSLVFGFVIALFIIEMLYWVNVILDKICSWQHQLLFRLFMQVALGVFFLLYLDVMLVKGFYILFDNDFEHSGFMEKIFPLNIVLVCMGHILFFLRWRYKHLFNLKIWYQKFKLILGENGKSLVEKQTEKPPVIVLLQSNIETSDPLAKQEKLMGPLLSLSLQQQPQYWKTIDGYLQTKKYTFPLNEVICICTGAVYGDIFLKNGRSYNMHYRRNILRKCLDQEEFVEVYAGIFYAYSGIDGYEIGRGKKVLLLKEGIKTDSKKFISRRYFEAFDIGFKNYQGRRKQD